MRSIWNGAVTFGLVSVPVKLYSATQEHDAALHQVHKTDQGRIRYKRTCEVCGEQVAYADIARAFEEDGRSVMLSEEELSSLPAESNREIEVIEFVPMDELDSIRLNKSYFLEPASKSTKPYVLLRKALEASDRTAIVRVTLRNKSRLGALRPYGDVILMQTLLWDDEIRTPDFGGIDGSVRVSAQELDLSAQLVASLSQHFEPAAFHDDYQTQLHELIESKLKKGHGVAVPAAQAKTAGTDAQVIDLMEALRRSVALSDPQTTSTPARRTTKKAAPKPTASKTSASKTGTSKTATSSAAKSAAKRPARKRAG